KLTDGEQASNPTFSPEGEWIAYLRWEGSGFEMKAIRIDFDAREVDGRSRTLVEADGIDSTCGLSWNTLPRRGCVGVRASRLSRCDAKNPATRAGVRNGCKQSL